MNDLLKTRFTELLLGIMFAVTMIWGVTLQFLPSHTTAANYLFNVGYGIIFLYGALAAFSAVKQLHYTSTIGKIFFFYGLGLFCYFVGLLVWAYYNIYLAVEIPYPSLADFFFTLYYPAIGIATTVFLTIYTPLIKKQYIVEGIIIFIFASIIEFGFVYKPQVSGQLSFLTNAFNIFYPLGDAILVGLAYMIIRTGGGRIHRSATILTLGLVMMTVADFLFTYHTAHNMYWNGCIADICYAISAFLQSLSLLSLYSKFIEPTTPIHENHEYVFTGKQTTIEI